MPEISASKHLLAAARDYSFHVSTERAIPRVNDGFKDSQRIAAWCMQGVQGKIKVSALSGKMIESNLYVHGNAEGTIGKMAAPLLNNRPIFDGVGLFGSLLSPGGIGAGRYIYVKKTKFFDEVVNVDSDLQEMVESVDGDAEMCDTFLPLIPLVLLNGVSGMGVGWSTDILPHKLEDLVEAVKLRLEGKRPSKKLQPFWEAYPDVTVQELDNGRTNADQYQLSGKVEINNSDTVTITTIPHDIKMDKVQEHLDWLISEKKIKDYDNHTTDKVKIVVKIWRNDLKEMVAAGNAEEQLVDLFKLRMRLTQRLVVVDFDGKRVRTFDTADSLIDEWVDWRYGFVIKRFDKMIIDQTRKLNFLLAIAHLFDSGFVDAIPGFKTKKEMVDLVTVLTQSFKLQDWEVQNIIGRAVYRWTKEAYEELMIEIDSQELELKTTTEIRSSDAAMKKVWINELKRIK